MKAFEKSLVLASLAVLSVLGAGCGGGGTQVPAGVRFSQTRHIELAGGRVGSDRDNIRVVVPSGVLAYSSDFQVDILDNQFPEISHEGWDVYPRGIQIKIDPDCVKRGQSIQIEMPYSGVYGEQETMLAVINGQGEFYALNSHLSANGQYVVGDLDFNRLDLLDTVVDDGNHYMETFKVFSATRNVGRSTPVLVTSVQAFSNGNWSGTVPDLTGKRVAVLVHGIDSSLADLSTLAQFLATYQLPLANENYYDVVIGFQYTSNNPLANIGAACAESLAPYLKVTSQADMFVHSMGNLVSRYAMETESLGASRLGQWVHHWVGLGGPHVGVPFANIPTLQTLAWLFSGDAYYCLLDLVTYGKGGAPKTSFLTNLNTTSHGPDFDTASYFTMSGSDYSALYKGIIPEGHIINGLYDLSVGFGTTNDGLVAEYSAQSNVLAQQSSTWLAGPTFDIDHTQLHTSSEAFSQIGNWIRAWGQQ